MTPITKTGGKSIQSKSTKDGQNKKPRSDDKELGGEESTLKKSKEEGAQAGFAVNLESMSASMKWKSPKATAARHKKDSAKRQPQRKRQRLRWPRQPKQERRRPRKMLPSATNAS